MSGLNFSFSENPNHYLIILGIFYAVSSAYVSITSQMSFWNRLIVSGGFLFGILLFGIGYNGLRNLYLINEKIRKYERDIKEEELKLIKVRREKEEQGLKKKIAS
jgi:hypothetical protein